MMPDKFEQKKKSFIVMQEELNAIEQFLRENETLISFDKPVHKGWTISVELRDDISKRLDAPFIEEALRLGYKTQHIRNVKHVKMMRAGQKGFYSQYKGGRHWTSFMPDKRKFRQREFDTLRPEVQKYFYLNRWAIHTWERDKYVIGLPSYWTILKARPYYVTHYVAKGGPLYQRKQFLRDKLKEFWRTSGGYYGNKGYWRYQYRPLTRSHIRKFIKNEIEDIPQVNYKSLILR